MTEMYSGLHVGQRFVSLDEFKTVVRSISVRQHWELRVARSNKKSVVIGCRSSANCYFRVVCRANKTETYITSLQDSHTCRRHATLPGTTPARSEASHVRFLLSEIPKLFDLSHKIKGQDVVDAVKRYHGYDISIRQAHRALTKLQPRSPPNQNEDPQSRSLNGDNQQDPQIHAAAPLNGSVYSVPSEQRWISDTVSSDFVEDQPMEQGEGLCNAAPQPAELTPEAVQPQPPSQGLHQARPTSEVQHPPDTRSQEPIVLDHSMRPNHDQHSNYRPSPQAEQFECPSQHRNNTGHASAPPMVLSSFRIEFTCTTCGALNQSFFPNQGNVTGGAYLPQSTVPGQGAIERNTSPSIQPVQESNSIVRVSQTHGYAVASVNARDTQPLWAPGNLPVSIPPTHT